jgi:hypothetical protein
MIVATGIVTKDQKMSSNNTRKAFNRLWWSSLGLSAGSNCWAVSKPTFRRPSLSSSSGY